MTLNELNQFFDSYDKVESRIKEVAPLCTKICESEEITRFGRDIDGVRMAMDKTIGDYYE